jgi:hypothetical protein
MINAENTLIAIIFLGVAAGDLTISIASTNWTTWTSYITSLFSLGTLGMYIWALLAWLLARYKPSDESTFVSWRVNFINFWVVAGVAAFNMIIAFSSDYSNVGWLVQQVVAGGFAAAGIYFGWFMKNLWYIYDPDGSMADSDLNWVSYVGENFNFEDITT